MRFSSLKHIPVASYQTSLLAQNGLPVFVFEYGIHKEKDALTSASVERSWCGLPFVKAIPNFLRSPLCLLWAYLCLAKMFITGRPRLMVAHGLHEQVLCWLLSKSFRVRYAVDVHEIYNKEELTGWNRLYYRLEKATLNRAEFLIFPEKNRLNVYEKRFAFKSPAYTVYNCPPKRLSQKSTWLKNTLGLDLERPLMLYWGGIGPENCLEAALLALEQIPEMAFAIVGWGEPTYLARLKALTKRLGLEKRAFVLGPQKKRWDVLESSDMGYCLYRPTLLRLRHAATASNKMSEYLAAGLPILTSPERDFKAVVEEWGVGLSSRGYDAAAIGDALSQWVASPALLQSQRENALRAHNECFHYEFQFEKAKSAFLSQIQR